jgi:hypothetical protein
MGIFPYGYAVRSGSQVVTRGQTDMAKLMGAVSETFSSKGN